MANYDNGVTLRELDPISTLTGEEQIFVDYEKAYKLTQDTVIIEGKTYYTYDPDIGIYTAVANPSIESITTYYEAVEAKRYALSRVTLDVQNEIDRIHYYGDKDVIPSDESYFTVNDTRDTVTGLTDTGKTQTELVIPYKINGVEITGIGSGAFNQCSSLTSINIPNSVTSIGSGAFNQCSSLTSINIPNSVTSIEVATFDHTALTLIEIPSSVTSIDYGAFSGCSSLTSITIPKSVTSIGDSVFDGCTNLTIYCEQGSYADTYAKTNNIPVKYTEVELKDLAPRTMVTNLIKTTNKNITKLQKYLDVGGNPSVVYSNFTLSDNGSTITGFSSSASGVVTIPYEINDKSVFLADGAFKDATASVQGLIFPDGGGDIPPSLCENMSTLAYLHLPKYSNGTPESIIYIWDNAFKNCTHLLYVEAHSKVSIWDSAFEGCTALETLDLSCGCDLIGANAFKGCTHLKNLILPRDLPDKSIDPTAFDGCTSLSICCEEGSVAEAFAIANEIPVRYTEISDNTLKGFVTDDVIENRNQYLNFTNSVFPEESSYTFSDDNTTITGVTTTPYSLTLPYKHNNVDVTTVGASAFKGNTSVVDVTIPKNIATIDSEAFSGCTGVYSVRVCGNITLGSQAFYGCTNLHTFTCEGNITLGSNAFEGTGLTSIDLTNIAGVTIGANVFKDCTSLKQVIIPSKVKIINAAAFSGCTNLTIYCEPGTKADTFAQSNNIPVVYINMPASTLAKQYDYYDNCFEIQKNFGQYDYNATYTPQDTFTYSADHSTITGLNADSTGTGMFYVFPYHYDEGNYTYAPVKAIGESAFKDNTNINAISVPASITTINSEAFSGCTDLASVTFYGACKLGAKAFCGCTNLMSVDMKSVPSIPESAFEGALFEEFVVPDGCTTIGANAFKDSILAIITIPASVITINDTAFTNCELHLIICEEGSTADRYAKSNNIPVKYTKVLKSTLDSKIDKTTITASTDGSITLADNTEFRVADTVASINLTVPTEVSDDFISSVVFKSGATATTISVTGTAKLCGDNVIDNVFTPVANRVYNIVFYNDGFNIVGVVGGYSS